MFVGHTAVALAAKSVEPRTSLGAFVAAAFALDLLWPVFLLLGLEEVRIDPGNTAFTPLAFVSYPWSHSLVMALVWGLVVSMAARMAHASSMSQRLLFFVVASHWVLDFISHGPDMPLWPGASPLQGLGLWNSVGATLLVEGVAFLGAVALYACKTRPKDKIGFLGFWPLVVFQLGLWGSLPWQPPPPSPRSLAWFGLGTWLFPLWAWWADGHRTSGRREGA